MRDVAACERLIECDRFWREEGKAECSPMTTEAAAAMSSGVGVRASGGDALRGSLVRRLDRLHVQPLFPTHVVDGRRAHDHVRYARGGHRLLTAALAEAKLGLADAAAAPS